MINSRKWMSGAKCDGLDVNIFFDRYEEDTDLRNGVDALCKSCPVQRDCLAFAVSKDQWGVWGGVYFEKGKVSREFNNHKKNNEWFDVWKSLTMEAE